MSRRTPILAIAIAVLGAAFFIIPLIATFSFSLKMKRGELSFDAYRSVFESDLFLSVLGYSAIASLFAIVLGILIVVPTAYWVRLRVPQMRPVIEFLSLMPLIIPPVSAAAGQPAAPARRKGGCVAVLVIVLVLLGLLAGALLFTVPAGASLSTLLGQ